MTFVWPIVLSLLLVPLVAVWTRRRPASPDGTRSHEKILRGRVEKDGVRVATVEGGARPLRSVQPRLWLGLAFVILALARPQWGIIEVPTYTQSREILVAIDLSRSMLATDVAPSRLDRTRLLVRGLLDNLKGERVGLIVFSGTAFLQCPLSADYEILGEFLPTLSPDFLPEGGTNYQALLQTALDSFSSDGGADRFLIVLSDGEATDSFWRESLPTLKQRQIRVLGLGVGTAAGSMIPQKEGGFVKDKLGGVVISKLESGTLRALAEATQGYYQDATTWVDLAQLVQATVEKGTATKVLDSTRERREERFVWFLAPGLLLLLWSIWREFPRSPRPRELPLLRAGVGLALLACFGPSTELSAQAPVPPPLPSRPAPPTVTEDSSAAPLVALSRELAGRSAVPAKEWARFAQATLDYARRRQGGGQDVSTQALRDGLAAVAEGEALDAKAAPWEDLRRELNRLLHPSPTPTPPAPSPTPSPKPTPSGSPSGTPPPQDQKGGTPPPDGQGPDKPSPPPQNEPQDGSKEAGGNEGKSSPSQPPGDPKPNAFKDLRPSPAPAPSPSGPGKQEKQKVGGHSLQRPSPVASVPPQLNAALQRLEQVRSEDKPADLQQMLRADSVPAEKPEKDW